MTSATHYTKSLLSRTIQVKEPNGSTWKVNQLQTVKWADLTAPEDTKILMDLVHKTRDLTDNTKHPIVVHCSAGVGRTGTFIAVYKLIEEYLDDKYINLPIMIYIYSLIFRKQNLSVYHTVVEMRGQRMKMVQKPQQYIYIFKCLRDEVKNQESSGYEA